MEYQNSSDLGSDAEEGVKQLTELQQHQSHASRAIFDSFVESIKTSNAPPDRITQEEATLKASPKIIDQVRAYQQELFEKAKDENIIAVLSTGSGKTLIACLLVRHVLAEELVSRARGALPKVVVFMANSIHLVRQQARVLESNLSAPPVIFCGDDKHDTWKKRDAWTSILENSTPVVCTPAILQQCLDAALISITQISLLIFDEAHHAKKNHPYCRLIRVHYLRCSTKQRPKIFGMTASPVDSKGSVDANAADLERLLHSKIMTTPDLSISPFAPTATDERWEFEELKAAHETDLCRQLRSLCYFNDELRRGFVFSELACRELGSWCADEVWRLVFRISEAGSSSIIKRYEKSKAFATIQDLETREEHLKMLQEAYELVQQHNVSRPQPNQSNLSTKVLYLRNKLRDIFRTNTLTRAMVFVDQRLTAGILMECIQQSNLPNVRAGVLIGHQSDSLLRSDEGKTLAHFRSGLINLIFATSVADEGIDVPQCNVCIRFDLYKSPIQYMQSRGRARQEGAIFAHMIERNNHDQLSMVQYAIDSDAYIRRFCQELPKDRLLGNGTHLERMLAHDTRAKGFKTKSGALCDFGNCLWILARFTSSLKHLSEWGREFYEEEMDNDNNQFRYVVRLPETPQMSIKGARGEWRPNKQLAKRSAAFNCCYLLRSKGLLDESLHSIFKKEKPENLNARLAVSNKKTSYPVLIKPSIWVRGLGATPVILFASAVHFKPEVPLRRPLASIIFLTRERLPDFPSFDIYVEENVRTAVTVLNLEGMVRVAQHELEALTNYTLDGVFHDVFNKVYEKDASKMSYWLAPATLTIPTRPQSIIDIVDMQDLLQTEDRHRKWARATSTVHDWTNNFICDPFSGKFHYFSYGQSPELNAFDTVPDWVQQVPQKARTSIIDFSDSHWKASKKKFGTHLWDASQPVLKAEMIMTRRNFLEKASEKACKQVHCLIAPQPLELSRLSPSFAASCLIWPSIIHRLEAYLLASDAFRQLGLCGVPADLALEAFTKDGDTHDAEIQVHSSEQHGMGKNYERLEFIGDSLLKMMTTITVFLRTKCDEEGMHCRRMEILCNRHLFEISTTNHELPKYVRTTGFNRSTWYPEHLVLLKGRGVKSPPERVKHPEHLQELGMKTIADVSEAIIGAAAVSARFLPLRFDLGIKAISTLVDSPDHAIQSWQELSAMYDPPEWSQRQDDVIANNLAKMLAMKTGYQFKCPRLVRSAFTHSSDMNATVPDLQRLEFLGDAVLDWVSISWLFSSHPERNPQWLTEHKMAMVSNKFLAALAVVLDFDKHIQASSVALLASISIYAQKVRAKFAEASENTDVDDTENSKPRGDFWMDIDSPPKALSDLVESYIGALLIDSNFDYDTIETFFNTHILWFFRDISLYDGFANRHPTSYLHSKFQNEYKCRDFSVLSSDSQDATAKVTAGVLVHGKVIAHCKGSSARYAKVHASKIALDLVDGLTREEFMVKFGCDCDRRGQPLGVEDSMEKGT